MVNVEAYVPELALIEIAKKDDLGSGINATTQISSISVSGFERPVESDPYFGNAKVRYSTPQEDGEFSCDIVVTSSQWYSMFHGGTGSDFTSGSTQSDFRITVLYKSTNVTVGSESTAYNDAGLAAGSLSGTGTAIREVYANANMSSFELNHDSDGYLQGTITFTLSPVDELGAGNVRIQEKYAGSQIAALGSYTSTNKW